VIHVGLPQVDEALLSELAALPAVREVAPVPKPVAPPLAEGEEPEARESELVAAGEVVKIVAEHSQQAIVNVLGYLNDRDISLTSLEILEPNLESVFLHLTGKKLRE
jgi:ABC-2 type transport system ATP-binding protein